MKKRLSTAAMTVETFVGLKVHEWNSSGFIGSPSGLTGSKPVQASKSSLVFSWERDNKRIYFTIAMWASWQRQKAKALENEHKGIYAIWSLE